MLRRRPSSGDFRGFRLSSANISGESERPQRLCTVYVA
jgi:hypothetical protein